MISIVICNKEATLDMSLEKNIQDTINTEFEIIAIDNSHGQYTIFQTL